MVQAALRGGLGFSLALALAVAAGGCDGGSTGDGGTGGTGGETSMGGAGGTGGTGGAGAGGTGGMSGIPGNSVQGTVDYAGSQMGTLIVGLYDTCPPMGPPAQLKVQSIDMPVFPQAFSLENIKAGSYYIAAVLDIGNDNPTQPGPEDLLACSAQVEITDAAGAETTITLEDQ